MQAHPASAFVGKRDLRIDWLRGLAMTCVIVNHSKLSSLMSWFSYERFWVVTAAEVFVVLSGIVIGMVYGRRLARDGWRAVARGLTRRALLLYAVYVGVTVSIVALAAIGVDVTAVAGSNGHAAPAWVSAQRGVSIGAWSDVLAMRAGPWAFEIVGLYVWLVAAAVPCLLMLHRIGWRPLLAASWALYLLYRVQPHALTGAGFEASFPLMAWQLLFVHGIAIGCRRDAIARFVSERRNMAAPVVVAATAVFSVFAFCNPWTDGPSWLRLPLLSSERFSMIYADYFMLSDLQAGRLINLGVALPVAYALLTRYWQSVGALERIFVTLGQRSLGAFVLHVYGLLLIAHLQLAGGIVQNTIVQIGVIVSIAVILDRARLRPSIQPRAPVPATAEPLAA